MRKVLLILFFIVLVATGALAGLLFQKLRGTEKEKLENSNYTFIPEMQKVMITGEIVSFETKTKPPELTIKVLGKDNVQTGQTLTMKMATSDSGLTDNATVVSVKEASDQTVYKWSVPTLDEATSIFSSGSIAEIKFEDMQNNSGETTLTALSQQIPTHILVIKR